MILKIVSEFYVIEKSGIVPRLKEVQKKVKTIRKQQATRQDEVENMVTTTVGIYILHNGKII